ncbi:hypothetical protein H2198_004548 [Neophaeococcomyces mojaviensis]|uniref:Uncharacterized protein n=1 Tax=Neophaeococcomyces mojaviensis TaxID=3383035 RepID=A0ACC3A866_9EURO|nr:hypothetical protein H2198_004548 [Knufia sp. JES_112]
MAVDQKGLRRYNATVERSLALFDPNSDWADYIAFLSRLLKSLESGKPDGVSEVPSKVRVALCLSRCLQPTLPSGVHQKALDVYNEIFSIIGVDGLARDLALYLPGLSHTLAFANLATRPLVLDLYEKYVLKLQPLTLRPALKALILSLLPVIEEETSEDFDRGLRTFDLLRVCFSEQGHEPFFWQTLFVASVSNPLRRAGVLVYLTRHLPKLASTAQTNNNSNETKPSTSEDTPSPVVTPEPGLLVRCFATGLRDEHALVQRGFLDLLVTHLPLSANVLQDAAYQKDLDVLVTAAMMVVLRRDMSLNRRLWAWFTSFDGKPPSAQVASPLESAEKQLELKDEYFINFGLASVVRSIQALLNEASTTPGPRTIPFRIVLSLMDRWEIGGPVVRASFALMMRQLLAYQSSAPTQGAFDEVFRSANVFFDGIESTTIFECLSDLLERSDYELISFIIANFNLEQAERVSDYIAGLGVKIANMALSEENLRSPLILLLKNLMSVVPQAGISASQSVRVDSTISLLEATIRVVCAAFEENDTNVYLPNAVTCFEIALTLNSSLAPAISSDFLDKLATTIGTVSNTSHRHFIVADASARVLTSLLVRSVDVEEAIRQQCLKCVPLIITSLWTFLDSKTPQYHVAIVEHVWRLHDLTFELEIVESTILDLLGSKLSTSVDEEGGIEEFSILFHHTKTVKRTPDDTVPRMLCRPVLRILDSLREEDRSEPGAQWLLSLQNVEPILGIVLTPQSAEEEIALTFNRVQKIIRVMKLAQSHWRVFSESSSFKDVYGFCLPLISEQSQDQSDLMHDAFMLLRTLYGDQSGNTPPEDLIALLVEKLHHSLEDSTCQEEVLDTLLAILTDKSVLPSSLVPVLLSGLSSVAADDRLDKWITLLCNFLPNHAALLPSLLKVTSGFCKRIEQAFEDLRSAFDHSKDSTSSKSPERSIANMLSGLEFILARSHQVVHQKSSPSANAAATGQEAVSSRSRANDRLTVTLCMQDSVKICARLWSWKSAPKLEVRNEPRTAAGDTKSFQYAAMKLRSRSRRMLENLIEAEQQECLETLISMWVSQEQLPVLDLLQTLNGARPRLMMPAVFNAIRSRTNPVALAPTKKSSLSVQLGSRELIWFLNEYTTALEDDMLEEIWTDCATFLKEILGNPMPHRQILIQLVQFCAVLSRKMENTNFTEESRMYRELADLCARLFTAIFTIKPAGFDGSVGAKVNGTKSSKAGDNNAQGEDNMLTTLVNTLPYLGPVLAQHDRLSTVYTGISTNITSPNLHSRMFPSNLTVELLDVMRQTASSSGVSKTWKKDMLDSFNHSRFFQSSPDLATRGWLPLIRQLQTNDKTMVTECLSRIAPPAAAGIMFGVGATAARNEADRRTQLELRRITTLILSSDADGSLPHLQLILQKVEELFVATPESSPSLATRGDVYILLRALLLKTTHSNLSSFWPLLDAELRALCKDFLAGEDSTYTEFSRLQGAKLLDLLLLMRPDEFQLHEWLFITDTIDAIYPNTTISTSYQPYADEIAPILSANGSILEPQTSGPRLLRKPWLSGDETRNKEDLEGLLAGFFGQLSIRAFEDLYSLQPLDDEACQQDLIADVFSDTVP